MSASKASSLLKGVTVEDLQRALEIKRKIEALEEKRSKLESDISEINREIEALEGGASEAEPVERRKPGRKPGAGKTAGRKAKKARKARKAAAKAPKKAASGKRGGRKKGVSITSAVEELLTQVGKPMRVSDMQRVLLEEKGVVSNSKNFYASLTATLQNSPKFKRVDRGVFGLVSRGGAGAGRTVVKKAVKKSKKKK